MSTKLRHPLGMLVLSTFASMFADAAAIYKLVDRNGSASYVESPPLRFDGKVLPVDIAPDTQQGINLGPTSPQPSGDFLQERRARWARVEAALRKARQRLDDAKTAVASATMDESDVQWVAKMQRPEQPPSTERRPLRPYESDAVGRDSRMCGEVIRGNKRMRGCARPYSEAFAARMDGLEAEVKAAEEEVAEAEIGYRRGMD